jgi:hypothetical protein
LRAISLLRCSTSRIERRKSFRTALSRLPASVDDVGANIALQTSELGYVTANPSPVHKFNGPFPKNGIPVVGVEVLAAGRS